MRSFQRLVIIGLLFVLSSIVDAQTEEPENDVVYFTVSLADTGIGDYDMVFFDTLQANLQEAGIESEVIYREQKDQALTNFNFHMQFDSESIFTGYSVEFEIFSSPMARVSPLLESHLFNPMRFFSQLSDVENAADVTTGLILYALDRCDLAVPYLNELTNYVPAGIKYFYLGNCAILEGQDEQARVYFQDARHIPASGFASEITLAWLNIQLGDKETAFELLYQTIGSYYSYYGKDRNYLELNITISKLYALAFEYDAAIAVVDRTIEIAEQFFPDYLPYLYTERGQRILLLYEWDRVLADYNYALELDPEYAPAYFHRGVLFYTQGPRENALEDFRRYLELAPDGEYSEQAAQYIAALEAELELLNP